VRPGLAFHEANHASPFVRFHSIFDSPPFSPVYGTVRSTNGQYSPRRFDENSLVKSQSAQNTEDTPKTNTGFTGFPTNGTDGETLLLAALAAIANVPSLIGREHKKLRPT